MDGWTSTVGDWIKGITAISLTLVTLGIVWQVLFGNSIPFIGGDKYSVKARSVPTTQFRDSMVRLERRP